MDKKLSALIIEDSEDDALILLHHLKKSGYHVYSERVETYETLMNTFSSRTWDIVFSDYSMPKLNGMQALNLIRSLNEEIPFIFVSGTIGEERAVNAIKQGASDYIIKGNLSRLSPVVDRALEEVRLRKENETSKLALEDTQSLFHHAFYNAGIGMVLIIDSGTFLNVNKAFCDFTGYSREELSSLKLQNIIDDECLFEFEQSFSRLCSGAKEYEPLELRIKHKNARKLWVILNVSLIDNPIEKNISYFIIQFQDQTEKKYYEEQMLYIKTYHPLTGLFNRNTITQLITEQVNTKPYTPFSVYLLDLDRFKLINEYYGAELGDHILHTISERFKTKIQAKNIGYLGGNEFVFIFDTINERDCLQLIESIRSILLKSVLIKQEQFALTASIGISQFPQHAVTAHHLIKTANIAMRHCKTKGGNTYAYFDPSMAPPKNRFKIEKDLRTAIKNHEIDVYYQPKFDSKNNKLSGMEALIRWKKDDVMIPPDEFIYIAEETGIIIELGKFVFERAIELFSTLKKKRLVSSDTKIAVNVSPKQLADDHFMTFVLEVINKHRLDPSNLELEITENALIFDNTGCINMLTNLKSTGIQIAIDDFGTGYSSLSYLKELQPDRLKIDQSFIQNVLTDHNSRSIITSIISLAHQLGLQVTAEGIETQSQHSFLLERQCDEFQGYLFSRPLSKEALMTYLKGSFNA